MYKWILAVAMLLAPLTAQAQMVTKTPPVTTVASTGTSPCLATNCTGPYGGSWLGASGLIGVDGGYQLWNGVTFLAGEVGGGAQVYTDPGLINNENGFYGYEIMKAGGSLTGLFGQTTNPPSNFPVIAAQIIAPYALAGAVQRDTTALGFVSGWTIGGGIEYDVTSKIFVDAKYMYNSYSATKLPNESVVLVGANYKF
jgi:opacity protein-like surface antigen